MSGSSNRLPFLAPPTPHPQFGVLSPWNAKDSTLWKFSSFNLSDTILVIPIAFIMCFYIGVAGQTPQKADSEMKVCT